MLGRLSLFVFVGLSLIACSNDGPEDDANDAPKCGGSEATLAPGGNTYDDTNPSKGTTPISFTMYVYVWSKDAPAPSGATGEIVPSCPSEGRIATTRSKISLPLGAYYACRDQQGSCGCRAMRLTGGDATFAWFAGPGGGNLEVGGCVAAP